MFNMLNMVSNTMLIQAKGHILYKRVGAVGLESLTSLIISYALSMRNNQTDRRFAGTCKF